MLLAALLTQIQALLSMSTPSTSFYCFFLYFTPQKIGYFLNAMKYPSQFTFAPLSHKSFYS